jgi:hypothetical protein
MMLEDLCRALCSGLDMRPVPIGYAIKTPFRHEDGDAIAVYLRRNPEDSGSVRFEDDGATIASLEESGVSLSSDTRHEALVSLLKQYDAQYDEQGAIIFSEYVSEDRAPANFAKFLALMLRVQDLRLFTHERVRRAFRDDVRKLLDEHFHGRVAIEEDENPSEVLKDYVADFVLRPPKGDTIAVFAASTELKSLEALLLWQEISRRNISHIKSMAILEGAKPQIIKNRTLNRLFNSGVMIGSMDGDKWELAKKMAQTMSVQIEERPN